MQHVTEVDLRSLLPAELPPYCLACFDRLAPGESMILVTQHDPKPLLADLQQERPNLFEWNPLEDHVDEHRVQVGRRAQGVIRKVGEFMDAHHHRLESLLAEIQVQAEQHLFHSARRRFAEFRLGLERHLTMEEAFVFPAFQRLGGTAEICARLLGDHTLIRRHIDELDRILRSEDSVRAVGEVNDLSEVLGFHSTR